MPAGHAARLRLRLSRTRLAFARRERDGVVDITILGAGPVGPLRAAYYAGHRDATVRIVESLEQLGGQVAATYPEKHVYDVAGHPKILGQKLVDLCVEQGLQYGAEVMLGEEAKTLERVEPERRGALRARRRRRAGPYLSRAMIVTAGPRRVRAAQARASRGSTRGSGAGLHYFVREKAQFSGKRCVIVGGGDSALDWTLGLQDTADLPITLVHRRDRFRALESSRQRGAAARGRGRGSDPDAARGSRGARRRHDRGGHDREHEDGRARARCRARR